MSKPLTDDMKAALHTELDPGESLRWSGKPNPQRMFRSAIPQMISMMLTSGVLAGLATYVVVLTWMEVSRIRPVPPGQVQPSMVSVYLFAGFAILLWVGFAFSVRHPFSTSAKARRTVYALTNTRVLIVYIATDGRVRLDSIEPGHPLRLRRKDHGDGTGDIFVHPAPDGRTSQFSLAATPNPREVDRLIRETFDPPARSAAGPILPDNSPKA